MVTKSRLRLAIAAEKGIDFKKLKEKKKHKENLKRKGSAAERGGVLAVRRDEGDGDDDELDGNVDVESEGDDIEEINIGAVDETDTSGSEIEMEEKVMHASGQKTNDNSKQEDEEEVDDDSEEDEEDIPISDLEDLDDEDREDLIPHTRLTINNTSALQAALDRISIPTDKSATFASHQSIVSSVNTADSIPDISDDLQRELAFYSQCLDAAKEGRTRLLAEGVPFSRPKDYFAEMVKEDAHMEKVKAKLIEEASAKKAAAEARKLRDLKKFGKQVQVAKLQERQKAKRETLEKIKTLKRKRQESGNDMNTNEADLFDVSVDNELAKHAQSMGSSRGGPSGKGVNVKRQKKNEKYGFGGKKRHAKSGDAISSGDLSSFNTKKMKAGSRGKPKASRPGKSRRKAMSSN
ncbi:rRNA processing protein (Ebp2), putative [Metarhizium acridum CQMa 102]|uniref:rRNA processing protein (Ebp2), putative n=1 Tax=Metarhizium acridum (strain CQMa 102) TaxID=655827 RepID=E9DXQ4_METAQ|nr:rRNA processing protein (Ebp2), putative [Metarhizium acridum CQMa 102]EFY91517.1 rRNA processing protein (Ebp2), putative [Metarhizium acridum CQMa 102]